MKKSIKCRFFSCSGSACNLGEGEEEEDDETMGMGGVRKSSSSQPLSVAQMVENNITAAKMKELRSQMQNLHLNNTSNIRKKPLVSSPKRMESDLTDRLVGVENKDIAIGAESVGFDSQAGQIEHIIPNGSPPLRCFFGAVLSSL